MRGERREDGEEARYHERISLRDVAAAVNLSPAHLTTTVRRKTGHTVQEWVAERRMAQSRRLLVETDLTVDEIGRKVGYADPVYFVRSFRRAHGTTPLRWRRAGRPWAAGMPSRRTNGAERAGPSRALGRGGASPPSFALA